MEMDLALILEHEKNNNGCIYFYAENEDFFKCYELSAYLLTRIYPFISLQREKPQALNNEIVFAVFGADFCREHLSGNNVEVGDEGIKVCIDHCSENECNNWIEEFKKMR